MDTPRYIIVTEPTRDIAETLEKGLECLEARVLTPREQQQVNAAQKWLAKL